ERVDSELFVAAAVLLSQPALAVTRARKVGSASLKLKSPENLASLTTSTASSQLADFAAATHLEAEPRELHFSSLSLLPISAIRHMVAPQESFCLLVYDSLRRLCRLIITRDELNGPIRLPEKCWSARKHLKWSRCLSDRYAWTHESNYGVIEERPKPQTVKTSLKNLSIGL